MASGSSPGEKQRKMPEITSFRTREVRWFLNHPCLEIGRWFEELPSACYTRESREDSYLVLPGIRDLGIKFREDRLELKYRLGEPRSGEIAPGILGYFESWEKLGLLSNLETRAFELQAGSEAHRIPALKQRVATQIVEAGSGEKFYPLGAPVTKGVQLEYTRLQVLGSDWYTVGLEWPDMQGISLPARLLSGVLPAPLLELKSSMGYPEFLHRLLSQK